VAVRVWVKYLAVLKGLSDNPEREQFIEGKSLASLLGTLRKAEHAPLKARLFSNADVRPDVLIFINDTEADLLGGLDAELKDGDKVTFLPSVHGG
jgi:molybdopterin synthase sulfur carrier subunit